MTIFQLILSFLSNRSTRRTYFGTSDQNVLTSLRIYCFRTDFWLKCYCNVRGKSHTYIFALCVFSLNGAFFPWISGIMHGSLSTIVAHLQYMERKKSHVSAHEADEGCNINCRIQIIQNTFLLLLRASFSQNIRMKKVCRADGKNYGFL